MSRLLLPFLILLLPLGLALSAKGQVTLKTENFDTDGEGTRYTSNAATIASQLAFNGAEGHYFIRTNTNPVQYDGVVRFGTSTRPATLGSASGSFWAGEGVRDNFYYSERAPKADAGTVALNSTTVSGYSDLKVSVRLADARGQGYAFYSGTSTVENTDKIRIEYSMDNGTWKTAGLFRGDSPNANSPSNMRAANPSTEAVISGGTILSNAFQTFTYSIPETGNGVRVRVVMDVQGASKELAFDDISVIGTVSATPSPTLAGIESSDVAYTEGQAAKQVTSALTVSGTVTRAVVSFSSGFRSGQDVLDATVPNGITEVYDGTAGTLTLTGSASASVYQTILQSITYVNFNTTNATAGSRTVQFVAYNGTTPSNSQARNVMVTTVLSGPASLPYAEDFESDGEGTRYATNTFSSSVNYQGWFRTNLNPVPNYTTVTFGNVSGSNYWYGEGTKNQSNPDPAKIGYLETQTIDATSYRNLNYQVRLATGQTGGSSNFETDDFFKLYYRVAGGSWTLFGAFYGNGAGLQRDTNADGIADGVTLNTTLTAFDFALPPTVTGVVAFRTELSSDAQEEVAFDNIRITGTPQTTINSIVRTSTNPTNAATVNYTVTFGAPVTGLTAANFSLTSTGSVSGATVGAPTAGSGNTWTVSVNTGSGSGSLTLNLANDNNLSYDITTTLPFVGETYTIDKMAPTVSSVGVPANGGYRATQTLVFTINFSESITVVGVPQLGLTVGSTSRQVSYVSGNGTTALTFSYLVQSEDLDGDGITLGTLTLNGGSLRDAATNNATLTLNGVPSTAGILVDAVVPSVSISTSAGSSGGNTSTSPIPFTVTFSEPVTGFEKGDLTVTGGSVTAGSFSGSGTTYTFTVTPATAGTPTSVNVAANVAQDVAGNGNTAAPSGYGLTFVAPTITLAPATATLTGGTQGSSYSATFTASGGTGTYSYVFSGTMPSGLTFAGSVLSGTPTVSGTFNFRITATDNSAAPGPYNGFRDYTLTIAAPAVTSVIWTGSVSTDWFTAGNWTPNQLPDATIDAVIPTAPSGGRFPVIAAGPASTRNLTINAGATLTHSNGMLSVNANLTNNGTFQPTGGTVALGGTVQSSILGSGNVRFWNLTVEGSGAQLSTPASTSVQRLLTLNGNFATNGNPFTLESNASGTAMVINNGSNVVSGNVTVQRYSNATNPGLGYHHYSSPVENTTIADLTTASFTPVVNDTYNSAPVPRQVQPYPTVYAYNQSRLATSNSSYAVGSFDNGFTSPSALANPLVPGLGYSVNVSGTNLVDFVGQLNNGTILRSSLARGAQSAAGWQFLGNPYPSPIDWNQLFANSSGIENGFYVYFSTSQYTGAYAAYVNGQGTNGGTSTIPSMQGFFVRAQPGGGSVKFTNGCRLTNYANPAFARQAADTRPTVRLELMTAQGEKDEALVYFEQGATSGVDTRYDALKLANATRLNLCSRVGSDFLAINGLPNLSTFPLTVPLSVQVPSAGRYTLLASQLANVAGNRVVLHDRQTGTLTDLTDPAGYVVELTEGQHGDRFALLFNPATEPTLNKKGQLVPPKRH